MSIYDVEGYWDQLGLASPQGFWYIKCYCFEFLGF